MGPKYFQCDMFFKPNVKYVDVQTVQFNINYGNMNVEFNMFQFDSIIKNTYTYIYDNNKFKFIDIKKVIF